MTVLMYNLLSPVLYYNLQTEYSCGTSESDRTPGLIPHRNSPLSHHFILSSCVCIQNNITPANFEYCTLHPITNKHKARGICEWFLTCKVLTMRSVQHLVQPPNWRNTPFRLSALPIQYIRSQPPSNWRVASQQLVTFTRVIQ